MSYRRLSAFICGSIFLLAQAPVEVVKVVSKRLELTTPLPGELTPYQSVAVYPKVSGFVEAITVDRGSMVKAGELLVKLSAPEVVAQRAAAQAQLQSALAAVSEAEARLAADDATFRRLKAASATPGVVSGNELEVAQKTADAARARVQALREAAGAAKAALQSFQDMEAYLQVKAPFDGVVTERNVHPGALVGPSGTPMLRIEQVARLRLVVAVPETRAGSITRGVKVSFSVPAFPGETFTGMVARVAHSVDQKTRTMPVELDVANPGGRLSPGMFPEVSWPVSRVRPSLFVPNSAVARTMEQIFVVRVRNGKADWVKVRTGAVSGTLIEVFGDLQDGDEVALRGTDELKPGTAVTAQRK